MNFVSIETPSARVATAGQTFEFLDALFRVVSVRLFLKAVPDESLNIPDEPPGFLPEPCEMIVAGHSCIHRLILREVESGRTPETRQPASLRERWLLRRSVTLRFHRLNNRFGEFRGAGGATHISSKFAAVAVNLINRVADLQGCLVFPEMPQHEQRGSQHGGGIGDILSRY